MLLLSRSSSSSPPPLPRPVAHSGHRPPPFCAACARRTPRLNVTNSWQLPLTTCAEKSCSFCSCFPRLLSQWTSLSLALSPIPVGFVGSVWVMVAASVPPSVSAAVAAGFHVAPLACVLSPRFLLVFVSSLLAIPRGACSGRGRDAFSLARIRLMEELARPSIFSSRRPRVPEAAAPGEGVSAE